jgi:hypothetical protein
MGKRRFTAGESIGIAELDLLPVGEWEVDRKLWIGRSLHRSSANLTGTEIEEERRVIAVSLEGGHLDAGRVLRAGIGGVEAVFKGRIGEIQVTAAETASEDFPHEVQEGRGLEH